MSRVLARILEVRARLGGTGTMPTWPAGLTRREVDVLRLVAARMSNREVAHGLNLSENTVAKHLTSIFNKTGCENRAAATAFAMRHHLAT
jgi:DNA-binding CsgD family transcriptional regulator